MIDSLEGDRDRIQTCNRLIRSQLLYSVELRGHLLTDFVSVLRLQRYSFSLNLASNS